MTSSPTVSSRKSAGSVTPEYFGPTGIRNAPGTERSVAGADQRPAGDAALRHVESNDRRIGSTRSCQASLCNTKSPRRGCPSNTRPNKSSASRSCQSAAWTSTLMLGTVSEGLTHSVITWTWPGRSRRTTYRSTQAGGVSSTTSPPKAQPRSANSHPHTCRSTRGDGHSMVRITLGTHLGGCARQATARPPRTGCWAAPCPGLVVLLSSRLPHLPIQCAAARQERVHGAGHVQAEPTRPAPRRRPAPRCTRRASGMRRARRSGVRRPWGSRAP